MAGQDSDLRVSLPNLADSPLLFPPIQESGTPSQKSEQGSLACSHHGILLSPVMPLPDISNGNSTAESVTADPKNRKPSNP